MNRFFSIRPPSTSPSTSGGRGQSSQIISMPMKPATSVMYIENNELSSE
jgi:hypothetical protein